MGKYVIELYVESVLKKERTIEEVPEKIREEVKEMLERM